jgi:uncharacterized protein (TIRG00374 family)
VSFRSRMASLKIQRWLPGLILSAGAIYFILKIINMQGLQLALQKIQPKYLLLGATLYLISLVARAAAWRILLDRKATIWQAFIAMNEGYLINNFLPFRLGELGRALLLGGETGLGAVRVLSTIIIERSFDLAIAAGLIISLLPFALGLSWAKPVAIATLSVVFLGFVVLFLLARNRDTVEAWIVKNGSGNENVRKHVLPQVDAFFLGLSALRNPLQFISSLGLMLLSWGIAIVETYVMLSQFVPGVQLWWCALGLGIIALGIAIPSAPASIGIWEASTIAALSLFNIDASSALAYGITVHLMNITINGIFGLYGLANSGKSISSLMHDLGLRQTPENAATEQTNV